MNLLVIALLYSARQVGQTGRFTRIASGCKSIAARSLAKAINYPHLETYFAPPYFKLPYAQQNRPVGIQQWLLETKCGGSHCVGDDEILVILDPDMLFLRPISNDPELERHSALQRFRADSFVARPGHPVAQGYGIGPFDRFRDICEQYFGRNESEGCQRWVDDRSVRRGTAHGSRHWSIGAPYLIAAVDMRRLAPLWMELTPLVWQRSKGLEADMYAYSMAAAHLDLVHSRVEHHLISFIGSPRWTPPGGGRRNSAFEPPFEGWKHIDERFLDATAPEANDHPCRRHTPLYATSPTARLPTLLHYCQTSLVFNDDPEDTFIVGFSKYRLPQDLLACDAALIAEPWAPSPKHVDVFKYNTVDVRKRHDRVMTDSQELLRREPFYMCEIILYFNAAIEDHKRAYCPNGFNSARTRRLVGL
jgi:hypothetical protein